jgi:predicted RNase H-like nuclease (RuvC/YqgF family)
MSDYDSWRIEALNDKNSELDQENNNLRIKIKELESKNKELEFQSNQSNKEKNSINLILKYNKLKIDYELLQKENEELKKDRDYIENESNEIIKILEEKIESNKKKCCKHLCKIKNGKNNFIPKYYYIGQIIKNIEITSNDGILKCNGKEVISNYLFIKEDYAKKYLNNKIFELAKNNNDNTIYYSYGSTKIELTT